MFRKASRLLCIAALSLLAVSCGRMRFHGFQSVDCSGWGREDTVSFFLGNERPAGEYELSLEVRAAASYPYRNLVARVEILSAGQPAIADTLCCEMYDASGTRKGATAGMLYQACSLPVPVTLAGSGTVEMRVSHIMDTCSLPGLYDVGLRLCSSNGRAQRQSSGM